jgi:hypothetical protein
MNELMGIEAFVEAVRLHFRGLVGGRCGHCNSSGCCCEWDGQPCGVVTNGEFCVPSVVHEFDLPESIFGVAPPSEDGLSFVGDFAPMLVEEDVAAGITEDSDQEEIVDKAGQPVGEACVGW